MPRQSSAVSTPLYRIGTDAAVRVGAIPVVGRVLPALRRRIVRVAAPATTTGVPIGTPILVRTICALLRPAIFALTRIAPTPATFELAVGVGAGVGIGIVRAYAPAISRAIGMAGACVRIRDSRIGLAGLCLRPRRHKSDGAAANDHAAGHAGKERAAVQLPRSLHNALPLTIGECTSCYWEASRNRWCGDTVRQLAGRYEQQAEAEEKQGLENGER